MLVFEALLEKNSSIMSVPVNMSVHVYTGRVVTTRYEAKVDG